MAPTGEERRLLELYVAAAEQDDVDTLASVLHDDLRFSMPPHPGVWEYRTLTLDVLRLQDELVREIHTFDGRLFPHLGLPATL